jgi:rhodanese-related sulfurtransferase
MATENEVYTKISAAEAKEKIEAGAAVVDTRPPADWAGGHVPGAQNLPLISIRGRSREIPEGAEVIFVCQDGVRSPQAAETAKTLGFEKVFVLDGGVNAWTKAGNALETIN